MERSSIRTDLLLLKLQISLAVTTFEPVIIVLPAETSAHPPVRMHDDFEEILLVASDSINYRDLKENQKTLEKIPHIPIEIRPFDIVEFVPAIALVVVQKPFIHFNESFAILSIVVVNEKEEVKNRGPTPRFFINQFLRE